MNIQLLRHATLLLQYHDQTWIIDPMFSKKGTLPPVPNTPNQISNPLVDLPIDINNLPQLDQILVTHRHQDHWDKAAMNQLAKEIPVLCQPPDEQEIRAVGFQQVIPVEGQISYKSIQISRVGGQHGTGEIAKRLAPVSGFLFEKDGEPTVYIVGDSIWCDEVASAITKFQPDIIICNAGEARFLEGDAITMGLSDIEQIAKTAPHSQIILVHMETWNHCGLTRKAAREEIAKTTWLDQVWIPNNGESRFFLTK